MDTKKLFMGTIVGGIACFFLGWVVYGMLLMETMAAYSNPSIMRAGTDMVWWAMILGNLGYSGFTHGAELRPDDVCHLDDDERSHGDRH
jgi:hypothetical protein